MIKKIGQYLLYSSLKDIGQNFVVRMDTAYTQRKPLKAINEFFETRARDTSPPKPFARETVNLIRPSHSYFFVVSGYSQSTVRGSRLKMVYRLRRHDKLMRPAFASHIYDTIALMRKLKQ